MTILDFAHAPHTTATGTAAGITLIKLGGDALSAKTLDTQLWRVTRATGEVLGYVDSFVENGDERYRAKRIIASSGRSLPLGEFWSFDDAVACFRS